MRRLLLLALITMLTAILPIAGASAADNADEGLVYLSLGDSLAAGTQLPAPFTDNGYTDVLYQRVRGPMGLVEHVNLACPGEDTFEMIDGDDGPLSPPADPNIGSFCYGSVAALPPGGPSQLDVAISYLEVHEGQIGLITITIGANDIFRCPDLMPTCVAGALNSVAENLNVMLPLLQDAAPGVPIVAMNYYNPNLALYFGENGEAIAEATNQVVAFANNVLETVYAANGVSVADVASAFGVFDTRTNVIPRNVMLNCSYTRMCDRVKGQLTLAPDADIHPNDNGYRRIAWAFVRTMKAEGIL